MAKLIEVADFLNAFVHAADFPDDLNGIYRGDPEQPVLRMGFALEPFPSIGEWIQTYQLDTMWLHRPWRLSVDNALASIGVIAHHLSFDERLTTGYNLLLAEKLGLYYLQPFGEKKGRPLGMRGQVTGQSMTEFQARVRAEFGGEERMENNAKTEEVTNVVVANALSPHWLEVAAEANVQLYITGQMRPSASEVARRHQISVLAIGHDRIERWGMYILAAALRNAFPTLDIWVREPAANTKKR